MQKRTFIFYPQGFLCEYISTEFIPSFRWCKTSVSLPWWKALKQVTLSVNRTSFWGKRDENTQSAADVCVLTSAFLICEGEINREIEFIWTAWILPADRVVNYFQQKNVPHVFVPEYSVLPPGFNYWVYIATPSHHKGPKMEILLWSYVERSRGVFKETAWHSHRC